MTVRIMVSRLDLLPAAEDMDVRGIQELELTDGFLRAIFLHRSDEDIHDNNGASDSHLAPMTGKANWNDFCDTLHAVGYEGDLNFETFAQAVAAIKFDQSMLLPWLQLICATGEYMRERIR